MTAKWGSCVVLAIGLAIMGGCRTPQPNLKPTKAPEQFVSPPEGGRYDTPGLPKQAYDKQQDPTIKQTNMQNGGMGGRGGPGGGAGGMGGGRQY